MYELVTGNPPEDARYKSPKMVNPYVPDWLDEMIIKSMNFHPSDRFQMVGEMIRFFNDHRYSEKAARVIAQEVIMGDKVEGNKPAYSYSIGDISNSTVSGVVQGENNSVIANLNAAGKD